MRSTPGMKSNASSDMGMLASQTAPKMTPPTAAARPMPSYGTGTELNGTMTGTQSQSPKKNIVKRAVNAVSPVPAKPQSPITGAGGAVASAVRGATSSNGNIMKDIMGYLQNFHQQNQSHASDVLKAAIKALQNGGGQSKIPPMMQTNYGNAQAVPSPMGTQMLKPTMYNPMGGNGFDNLAAVQQMHSAFPNLPKSPGVSDQSFPGASLENNGM